MIEVVESYVNGDANNIYLNINIENAELTNIIFQTSYQYLYTEEYISLNHLIDNPETQSEINITLDDVNRLNFYGIFYITLEFKEKGEEAELKRITTVVYNLNNYKECIANYILQSNICTPVTDMFTTSSCNDSNLTLAITGDLLLNNIVNSLTICDYTSSDFLYEKLSRLCNKCKGCGDSETGSKIDLSCKECNK